MDETYEKGKQDGLRLYGRVCSHQSRCDGCMIGQLIGETLTCQEFMSSYPQKMLSLLTEMDKKEYTYYDEFVTRFPSCNLSLPDLAETTCRKLVFEGVVDCENGDCEKCWKEIYVSDVSTVFDEDEDKDTESVESPDK